MGSELTDADGFRTERCHVLLRELRLLVRRLDLHRGRDSGDGRECLASGDDLTLQRPTRQSERIGGKDKNQIRFEEFHRANPHVFEAMRVLSTRFRSEGFEKGSISLIVERLRYVHAIRTKSTDGFAIANAHRAYYARLLMAYCPDLVGWFRTAKQENPYVIDWDALGLECPAHLLREEKEVSEEEIEDLLW